MDWVMRPLDKMRPKLIAQLSGRVLEVGVAFDRDAHEAGFRQLANDRGPVAGEADRP